MERMLAKGPRKPAATAAPTTKAAGWGPGGSLGAITEEEKSEQQSNLSEARAEMVLSAPIVTRKRAATKRFDTDNFDF